MTYLIETLVVATGAACVVALYARNPWSRAQHALLLGGAGLAVLVSALSYFDDWRGQPPAEWLHEHDFYHYYFGAKYFAELGYMRLYVCTAAALQERARDQGQASPVTMVRRLEAPRETLSGAPLARAAADCRGHFDAARWRAFRADLDALGRRLPATDAWQGMLVDLGNNSPPSWNLVSSLIANRVPLTTAVLDYWPLVDQLLLCVLLPLVVWRSFGTPAVLAYGLMYFASPLAFLGWTGGSFQRADWYVALVGGLCALATRRVGLAGALLAFASACRVFPVLFALAVPVCLYLQGQRMQARRFVLVGASVLAVLIGASALMFNPIIWSEFAMVMHLRISPYGANTIGLHKLAACWNVLQWPSFAGDGDALRDATQWLETLAADAARRQGVSLAITVALAGGTALVLRARAVMFSAVWVGLLLLYVLLTPFTYYYVVLALLPLAITALDGRVRAVLMALALLGLLALRAVSVPALAELGRNTGYYAVSLHSSHVLLITFAAILVALALADLLAASPNSSARRTAAMALSAGVVALLLSLTGYRSAAISLAHFHDLASLGPISASRGVTVRERPATASWPGAHFFEVQLAGAAKIFAVKLGALPAGRYRVSVVTTAAPGYGRVRVRIGGQERSIDGQRDDGRAVLQVEPLGEIELDADSSLLAQAEDTEGARIGLSGLVLEPVPSL